jgi:type IV pilus assembly protein PilO
MRLSDKDKKLLIFLLLIGILAFIYFFIYSPFANKLALLKQEVKKLQTDMGQLQAKAVKKDQLSSEIKFIRYELEKINNILPPNILQERVILILKDLENITGIKLNNLAFTAAVPLNAEIPEKKQENDKQQNLQNQMTTQHTNQGGNKTPDNTGIKMQVKANYTATYAQIKSFLEQVMNFTNKIVITDISFSSEKGNYLTGSVTLNFYGIKDSTQKIPEWNLDLEKGKDNIFQPFEGYIVPQAGIPVFTSNSAADAQKKSYSVKPFDFYIVLNPITDDAPTVILGKHKKIGSEIYADGNKNSNVEIHINEQDGKFYYSYKTEYGRYPSDNKNEEEFIPVYHDHIVLNIISRKRLNEKDNAGADIKIYNNTSKKIIVRINKEEWKSRANISFEGDGAIERE